MASEMTIETVLGQFSLLAPKEQVKFAAEMAKYLQGQPKKSAKKASAGADGEEKPKPKREASAKQVAWMGFVKHVTGVIKAEDDKFIYKNGMSVASKLRDEGNAPKEGSDEYPEDEVILDAWREWVANPTPSKAALKKAEKESASETASVASAEEKPKRTLSDEQKAKMKAGREAAAERKKAEKEAEKVAEKAPTPKATTPKAEAPKAKTAAVPAKKAVVAPPPPAEEEEKIETQYFTHEGKKLLQNKVAPLYTWTKDMEYLGVYDPKTNKFDTTVADPLAEEDDE